MWELVHSNIKENQKILNFIRALYYLYVFDGLNKKVQLRLKN